MLIDQPQLNITLPNFKRNEDALILPTLPSHKIKKKSPPPNMTHYLDNNSDSSLTKKKKCIKRPKFSLADSESLDARRKNHSTSNGKNYFTKDFTNFTPFNKGPEIKIINENDF
jgi:hypothetical protein